ncbi:3'-5' exonuclease [Streptomyces sp. NBC_01571]|uniref:3'-5' exonuclease n=1 Tax=Streptomyces sp. NBC_01571 TaxID=2975883 RepID=UPI002251D208|nr:3'-5' exonuclease [Streptomyces sp. NBC_01571]MCX4580713.1 3'-5' exonuclease [Streptomyces sp. NBC_01571]
MNAALGFAAVARRLQTTAIARTKPAVPLERQLDALTAAGCRKIFTDSTTTELKAERLKPADGQQPVALVRVYRRGHGWGEFPLFDPAAAAPMRTLSAKQQAAMTARRTCPKCGQVRRYVVHGQCHACIVQTQEERLALQARTCWTCRRVSGTALPKGQEPRCLPCWMLWRLRRQFEEERAAVARRTCLGRDCQVVTATDEEIAAVQAAGTWFTPRWCPPCKERDDREREEARQRTAALVAQAQQARRDQVAGLERWAGTVLADPDTVVLDTETTGLHDAARIIDLGVLSITETTLMDRLLDPGEPVPASATDVHGLTDDDVRGAPTFSDVFNDLTTVLAGKRVLIYNKAYDAARLRHELQLHYRRTGHPAPRDAATAWLAAIRCEDAMIPYSDWCGDWSDYWGNYTWQPLPGSGHRAIPDCRAVVERLREMAEGRGIESSDEGS